MTARDRTADKAVRARVTGTSQEGLVIRDLEAIPSVVPGQHVPRTVQVKWDNDPNGPHTWHVVVDGQTDPITVT